MNEVMLVEVDIATPGADAPPPVWLVEVAGDIAARLEADGQDRLADAQDRAERLALQFGFDGWAEIHGTLAPVTAATVAEPLDAAADPPVNPDVRPTDDDGRPLPPALRPPTSRAVQWAQALERIASTYLAGGPGRPARPSTRTRHRPPGRPDRRRPDR